MKRPSSKLVDEHTAVRELAFVRSVLGVVTARCTSWNVGMFRSLAHACSVREQAEGKSMQLVGTKDRKEVAGSL